VDQGTSRFRGIRECRNELVRRGSSDVGTDRWRRDESGRVARNACSACPDLRLCPSCRDRAIVSPIRNCAIHSNRPWRFTSVSSSNRLMRRLRFKLFSRYSRCMRLRRAKRLLRGARTSIRHPQVGRGLSEHKTVREQRRQPDCAARKETPAHDDQTSFRHPQAVVSDLRPTLRVPDIRPCVLTCGFAEAPVRASGSGKLRDPPESTTGQRRCRDVVGLL
jgi:hypothetical protein